MVYTYLFRQTSKMKCALVLILFYSHFAAGIKYTDADLPRNCSNHGHFEQIRMRWKFSHCEVIGWEVQFNNSGRNQGTVWDTKCGLQDKLTDMMVNITCWAIAVTGVGSVCANCLVLLTYFSSKPCMQQTRMLPLISLAICDLMIGSVYAPILIFFSLHGKCHMLWVPINALCFIAIQHMVFIAADRFYAVFWPFKYRTSFFVERDTVKKMLMLIWTNATVLSSLPLLSALITNYESLITYSWYHFSMLYGFYIIPIIVITVLYILFITKIYQENRKTSSVFPNCPRGEQERLKVQRKYTVFVAMLLSSLLLTYLPNLIWDHDHDEGPDYDEYVYSRFAKFTMVFTNYLCVSNSLVNPLLYFIRLDEFRKNIRVTFKNLLGKSEKAKTPVNEEKHFTFSSSTSTSSLSFIGAKI